MGVNPVVRALHLDYARLKRRVSGQVTAKKQVSPTPEAPTFVELAVNAVPRGAECAVEFEGRGGKVTMRLAEHDSRAIVALHRAGHIALPPVRCRPPNNVVERRKPAAMAVDSSPLRIPLSALQPLSGRTKPSR